MNENYGLGIGAQQAQGKISGVEWLRDRQTAGAECTTELMTAKSVLRQRASVPAGPRLTLCQPHAAIEEARIAALDRVLRYAEANQGKFQADADQWTLQRHGGDSNGGAGASVTGFVGLGSGPWG